MNWLFQILIFSCTQEILDIISYNIAQYCFTNMD